MAHKFDPGNMKKLDDEERKDLLPARDILVGAGLEPGQCVLDVGAGTGYFAFPACAIVGDRGRVIAVDISDRMIEELQRRASAMGLRNMEIRRSEEYDIPVEGGTVDMTVMSTVLHEVDDKVRFLGAVAKALAPGGRVCVIEWEKKAMDMGPPLDERLDPRETAELLGKAGFAVMREKRYGGFFYCLVAAIGKDGRI